MNMKQQQALFFSDVPIFIGVQRKEVEKNKSEEVQAANPKDL